MPETGLRSPNYRSDRTWGVPYVVAAWTCFKLQPFCTISQTQPENLDKKFTLSPSGYAVISVHDSPCVSSQTEDGFPVSLIGITPLFLTRNVRALLATVRQLFLGEYGRKDTVYICNREMTRRARRFDVCLWSLGIPFAASNLRGRAKSGMVTNCCLAIIVCADPPVMACNPNPTGSFL